MQNLVTATQTFMENVGKRRYSRSSSPPRSRPFTAHTPQQRAPGSNFRQHLFNMIFFSKLRRQFTEEGLLAHPLDHFCTHAPEELNRVVGKQKIHYMANFF